MFVIRNSHSAGRLSRAASAPAQRSSVWLAGASPPASGRPGDRRLNCGLAQACCVRSQAATGDGESLPCPDGDHFLQQRKLQRGDTAEAKLITICSRQNICTRISFTDIAIGDSVAHPRDPRPSRRLSVDAASRRRLKVVDATRRRRSPETDTLTHPTPCGAARRTRSARTRPVRRPRDQTPCHPCCAVLWWPPLPLCQHADGQQAAGMFRHIDGSPAHAWHQIILATQVVM